MIKNTKLRTRLLLGSVISIISIIAMVFTINTGMNSIMESDKRVNHSHNLISQGKYALNIISDMRSSLTEHLIFGSDELSGRTPAIAERCPGVYLEIDKATADGLGVDNGDGVEVNELATGPFEVVVNPDSPANAVGFPVGLEATNDLCYVAEITLTKAENWTPRSRPDNLITTDK